MHLAVAPAIPRRNTDTAVVVFAEKATAMILEDATPGNLRLTWAT